jgi:protein-disulfide isomerase
MKRYLPFIIIAAVAVLTAGAGAMLYRRQHVAMLPAPADAQKAQPAAIDPNGPVVLEEFGDFQCPSCALVAVEIKNLEQTYGPKLRVVFHNFPLKMHSHALEAAIAAEAARSQNHFSEMHDLLYESQPAWSRAANVGPLFDGYAKQLGLDVERFRSDIGSKEVNLRVAADVELGLSRGVKSTPTIFIDGAELPAPFTAESLRAAIDTALAAKNKKP